MSQTEIFYTLLAGGQVLGLIVLILVALVILGGCIEQWRQRRRH